MRIITISLMLLMSSTFFPSFGQIKFKKINIEEAKKEALAANKEVFIDFRADWCKPCIEMERTTFSDRQVGSAINQNYIPIQIDVDFFEGMDVQELYNVGVMPTILIINSDGEVQKRLLGQKTPYSLMQELNLPYRGKGGDTDAEPTETEVEPTEKKECFLTRWWRKITS
jgi:thiol:disulfide interchange protein